MYGKPNLVTAYENDITTEALRLLFYDGHSLTSDGREH